MKIKISTAIYPIESILSACYSFIDKFFFFLDADPAGKKAEISFKPKKKIKNLESLTEEFKNELVYAALRYHTHNSNKKITEYIVGRALTSAFPGENNKSRKSDALEDSRPLFKDPLGIAIPWEEKYGKKIKNLKDK